MRPLRGPPDRIGVLALAALVATTTINVAAAQPPSPAPETGAYPGVIGLHVDVTDLRHAIFNVHETIPLAGSGPVTLLFPKWMPGHHSPSGPIDKLAGLRISIGGRPLTWRRDPVNVFAFHLEPPAGAATLDIDFQYLSPVSAKEGAVQMTPDMLNLEWNGMVLYPAGYASRQITVAPSVTLPAGFAFATALDTAGPSGASAAFRPVTLDVLADSPLVAGRYFKRFDLAGGRAPVRLNVFADRPGDLAASPADLAAHVALVNQADRLFGARHFAHYDFLLWLSERMGAEGLEHQQSSQDGTRPNYFTASLNEPAGRDLLAHEYVHSWNGKFRRPADLLTPDFGAPMQGSLLWVYEGQTQYWGFVLAARSGLLSRQDALDAIALTAATYDQRIGRAWRPLIDTTNDPVIASRRPLSWPSWQRSEDYYSEGELIWLDADTLIREQTGGRRSLDDFARGFFGFHDGAVVPEPYTFDDIVAALNAVRPFDWSTFLHTRLEATGPRAPLDGLARGGYRLVFTGAPSEYQLSDEVRRKVTDLAFGLGLTVNKDGTLASVEWDGPAFKAGLAADSQIVAVGGEAYTPARLKDAVAAAKDAAAPILLLVESGENYRTVAVDYHGGPRYPHLERIAGAPARLDDILAPRS